MKIDLCSLLIGAVLGVICAGIWNIIKTVYFWFRITRKLKGRYKVTLKNGHNYPKDRITSAEITKARGKTIEFEMDFTDPVLKFGNSTGEVIFSTKNYGRGWYRHKDATRYGFVEMILLPKREIAVYRKFTRDEDTSKPFTAEETSFIWSPEKKKSGKV